MAGGSLQFSPDGNAKGRYSDLHHKFVIAFEKNADAPAPGSDKPSHDVYVSVPGGELSKCGAAWTKVVTDGANRGQKFYSFYIDDPSFGSMINLTAFQARDEKNAPVQGLFDVVWRRQRAEAA